MQPIIRSEKLSQVHSDIRGPVYVEAMKMIAEGTPVLRLNTGNPATLPSRSQSATSMPLMAPITIPLRPLDQLFHIIF